MAGRVAAVGPGTSAAAPPPGVAGTSKADLVHQLQQRFPGKTNRRCEFLVDRIIAARRTHLARVARKTVGKVDPDPGGAEPAISELSAAWVCFGGENRCTRRGQRGHRRA